MAIDDILAATDFPIIPEGEVGKPAIHIKCFFLPENGNGTSMNPHCNNQPVVFVFVIGKTTICNNQPAAFIFCHSRRGKGENDTVDCFYFSPVPQHEHLPSTHSARINWLFLCFAIWKGNKGGKPQCTTINLLFLFFPFEWEMGK